jgi:hypothetical protein
VRQPKEPTREEKIAEARENFEELITRSLEGCGDPKHREAEDAAQAMVKGLFLTEVLPGKIRDAAVSLLVHDALHSNGVDAGNPLAAMMGGNQIDLRKSLAKLGDVDRVHLVMLAAGVTMRVLGIKLDEASLDKDPLAGIKLTTGLYA